MQNMTPKNRGPPRDESKTDLGRLLRKAREGKEFIEVIRGSFCAEALRKYESGDEVPPRAAVSGLARCYEVPSDVVMAAYYSSIAQITREPLSQDSFLNTLSSSRPGDHLIAITQSSFIGDDILSFANPIYHVLKKGVSLTTVAYLPTNRQGKDSNQEETSSDLWHSTHYRTACDLTDELYFLNESQRERIRFLFIGNPSLRDFTFLAPSGANIYLCRANSGEEAGVFSPQAWYQQRDLHGRNWFTSHDLSTISQIHSWLTNDCGLQLPGSRFQHTPVTQGKNVRYLTLADVLTRQECSSRTLTKY